jgi:hypothetical protein
LQKRTAIRVSCDSEIHFEVEGQTFQATAVDVSTRGLFIASEQPPKENSLLRMTFSLPGAPATRIRATGRGVWINHRTLPRKKDFPPGFGVAFVDLEDSDRKRLLTYVDSLLGCNDITASSPS